MGNQILIISPPTLLLKTIVDKLLINGFLVFLYTNPNDNRDSFQVKNNDSTAITNLNSPLDAPADIEYILEIITPSTNEPHLTQPQFHKYMSAKKLFVLPADTKSFPTIGVKTLFLGEIIDKDLPVTQMGPAASFLTKLASEKSQLSNYPTPLETISLSNAVDNIFRNMFSFSSSENIKLADRIDDQLLAGLLEQSPAADTAVQANYKNLDYLREFVNHIREKQKLNEKQKSPSQETQKPVNKIKKPKEKRHPKLNYKIIRISILILLWSLTIPFLSIFVAVTSATFAYKKALSGSFNQSSILLSTTKYSSFISKNMFYLFSKTPIVGNALKPATETAILLENTSLVGKRAIALHMLLTELKNGVLGNEHYDIEELSSSLYVELDALYEDVSFFEGNFKSVNNSIVSLFPTTGDIFSYRGFILSSREIAKALPNLLGKDSPKTYAILFQNNMELRPTGGFIGSFALITFDNGKLIDTSVYDVYSADGQLKGHITPPQPIRDYLGEASWYLRDANWDPDFTKTAARVEWFLDKSMDRSVDGVIAIDLEVVKNILKYAGPVEVTDYSDVVDDKNLYQKIQYQVESEFFPGSRKKANYLTSLTKGVINKLTNLSNKQLLYVTKGIFENFESRDIQAYIHNDTVSDTVKVLGWNGQLTKPSCQGNCEPIWFGINEANLGVNKANYYISRSAFLMTKYSGEYFENTLTLTLINNSKDINREPETRYKAYVRLMTSKLSLFENVLVTNNFQTTSSKPELAYYEDRVEAGTLVNIPPDQSRIVIFRWKTPKTIDINNNGKVVFTWLKQSGVNAYPIAININLPQNLSITTNPSFVLTDDGTLVYNTHLVKDFNTDIFYQILK